MKSEALVVPTQQPAALEDLSSFVVIIERALKAAMANVHRARSKGAKASGAIAIEKAVGEIERLKVEISGTRVVLLRTKDQYVIASMMAIVPKLPTLIENKRDELLEEDIARFVASVMPSDPLKDVLLDIENDNIALREQFVKSNACLDSKTLAKNAGYSGGNLAQPAWRWKSKGQIFSVEYFGKELFPAFQFRDGKPLPIIKKLLDVIGNEMSSWQIAFWFVAENGWLDGQRPVDLMVRAEDKVLEAAKRAVERAQY